MRRALLEYEVGGIKTTLPFFREIMEDEEFIAGKLDTGFIARFNERKKEREVSETEKHLALIASALAYADRQKSASSEAIKPEVKISRWASAGRINSFTGGL